MNIHYSLEQFEYIQAHYDGKVEYYDGEIWLSSNASDKHNDIIVNISAHITFYLMGSKCKVKTEGMEVIFDEKEKYKLKPDVFIVCQDDIDNMKGESYTTPPKVIFEIVAPGKASAIIDKQLKYNVYEQYGVLEYNIVDMDGVIIQYKLVDGLYKIANLYRNTDKYVSIVFHDLEIDLKDIF